MQLQCGQYTPIIFERHKLPMRSKYEVCVLWVQRVIKNILYMESRLLIILLEQWCYNEIHTLFRQQLVDVFLVFFFRVVSFFLPEASFWPSGIFVACICLAMCLCAHASVCQPWACLCDNLWPIEARITKFGPEVQNTLIKVPIALMGVPQSPSSVCTYIPRPLHSPDCFTVSTLCSYIDLY